MVRWRSCIFLAMLIILPVNASSKLDDDEDEKRVDDGDDDDEDENDDDEDIADEKLDRTPLGRRAPAVLPSTIASTAAVTRTARHPLECYVCAYKAETQLRSCLDPTKYRVHTMICHSAEDKCFTSVIAKGNGYEAVLRGCRSACLSTPETTCCELNRCNNQALAAPVIVPRALTSVTATSNSTKTIPPSVLFFVTILLLLQTVAKVPLIQ